MQVLLKIRGEPLGTLFLWQFCRILCDEAEFDFVVSALIADKRRVYKRNVQFARNVLGANKECRIAAAERDPHLLCSPMRALVAYDEGGAYGTFLHTLEGIAESSVALGGDDASARARLHCYIVGEFIALRLVEAMNFKLFAEDKGPHREPLPVAKVSGVYEHAFAALHNVVYQVRIAEYNALLQLFVRYGEGFDCLEKVIAEVAVESALNLFALLVGFLGEYDEKIVPNYLNAVVQNPVKYKISDVGKDVENAQRQVRERSDALASNMPEKAEFAYVLPVLAHAHG